MKCPYDRWTGPFKSYGKHMAAKHRRIMLRNLAKARRAPRRRREAKESPAPRTTRHEPGTGYSAPVPGHYCPVCGRMH